MNALKFNLLSQKTIRNSLYLMLIFLFSGLFFSNAVFGQCTSADLSTGGIIPIVEDFLGGGPACEGDYASFRTPELSPGDTYTTPDNIEIVVTSTTCGPVFSFTAPEGIKIYEVFVKGATPQNVYSYEDGATSDGYLHAPVNSSGKYAGLSHIDFCFAYALDISKTANAEYTRTINWDITKTVDPVRHDQFIGESSLSEYTITLDKTITDNDWAVSGKITIENNTPYDATITNVTDVISGFGGSVTVDCGSLPFALASGGTKVCTYSVGPINSPNLNPFGNLNTATVITSSPAVEGGEATAGVTFGDPTTVLGEPDQVNVTDDLGTPSDPTDDQMFGPFGNDDIIKYERTFSCGGDLDYSTGTANYSVTNIAKIDETGDSDDATVDVYCYAPVVSKTASTSFTRTWDWTIEKSCNGPNPLTLSEGQVYTYPFSWTVSANDVDSDFGVSGTITVDNPHPTAAMTVSLADILDDGTIATLDCGGTLIVPAAGSATCNYEASPTDNSATLNTATATLNSFDFSGTAGVTFGNPSTELDKCIAVTDDCAAPTEVCVSDLPFSKNYTCDIGPYDVCGDYTYTNTASFVTKDLGKAGSDNCVVNVNVPCQNGCTLTQGYWKTHNETFWGGASNKADATWQLIEPDAEQSTFFLSGQSYFEVLWTAPQGNVYYNLAKQYIAAYLNYLNGADFSDVQAVFDEATEFFESYTPADAAGLRGKAKKDINTLASILDDYNNGLIGPGHCDEDDSSDRAADQGQTGTASSDMQIDDTFERSGIFPANYQIRPNPVRDQFELAFDAAESGHRMIHLYSITGELLKVMEYEVEKGQNVLTVYMDEISPNAGIYFLSVNDESSVLWNGRFIKY